uniref:Spliceosome-associated protein CWC27 homolog n=1 Tax=Salarias fasciatus TaxID=181472 RepID=A0A672GEZ0_SALFA
MSNIYIQEPPTNGKVLLKTSAGEIDIELWSKEAPKACRNFVQLCMEGYYDGTIFHRVVPEFIIQGGDPTGTGEGGESIYGRPFKDEFHSRLRFIRRGLVAMANAGPHDNGSQFFFTLGRADELNNKHTIFGKVTGDTVYNMLRLAEVECDHDERPLKPHKIRTAEVLHCPFDDIEPRETKKSKKEKDKEEAKKSQSKATKNFSLLSFGEEAEEEEEVATQVSQTFKGKSKSSHDLLKDDPRLSSVPAVDKYEQHLKVTFMLLLKSERIYFTFKGKRRKERLEAQTRSVVRQIAGIKAVNRSSLRRAQEAETEERFKQRAAGILFSAVYKINEKCIFWLRFLTLGRFIDIENKTFLRVILYINLCVSLQYQTMALLDRFKSKLSSAITEGPEEEDVEELAEDDDKGWLGHVLQFDEQTRKVKDANMQDEDTFEIYDPRNPVNKRRREESKKIMREKKAKR